MHRLVLKVFTNNTAYLYSWVKLSIISKVASRRQIAITFANCVNRLPASVKTKIRDSSAPEGALTLTPTCKENTAS